MHSGRARRAAAWGALGVLGVTVVSGAFVAGNKVGARCTQARVRRVVHSRRAQAGLVYNEFPKMGGRWVPQDIRDPHLDQAWRNVFENSSLVQFDHRVLVRNAADAHARERLPIGCAACAQATSTLATAVALNMFARRFALQRSSRAALAALGVSVAAQYSLGVATLLTMVPVPLGVAHQLGALSALSSALWFLHTLGPAPRARAVSVAAASALGLAASAAPPHRPPVPPPCAAALPVHLALAAQRRSA